MKNYEKKMFFSFSRYSIICNLPTFFPQFQEFKGLDETGIIMTS